MSVFVLVRDFFGDRRWRLIGLIEMGDSIKWEYSRGNSRGARVGRIMKPRTILIKSMVKPTWFGGKFSSFFKNHYKSIVLGFIP